MGEYGWYPERGWCRRQWLDGGMSANLTQAETAARAAMVEVHSYRVDVDIRDAVDPAVTTFPVVSEIVLTMTSGDTWLDFIGASVDAITVDGTPFTVDYDGSRIALTDLQPGRRTLRVEATALYSRTGEGLHRFVDPADGETYLYTQYEPADARRVFPDLEQPDLRAPFTFSLTGPEGWWFGSNQPEASRAVIDDGVVTVVFEPTRPLSTYITCLCAGPYHRVTDAWQGMELGLLSRRSLADHLDADELFRITRSGLDWFTANFGGYPWGSKYDQIFVPEYNLGAMENPGLVTFTEAYLFRSPATPAQLQARANTIVHEMSHMWFGDLVTCRWWGDLWLKESFAEFMGSHVSVEACGFVDGWVNFATGRKVGAYQADSMPTTHPIVARIDDLEAAKTNFDRITYSKGAAALTQLVHYIGLDDFLAGARTYFAAHAFSSATLTDFVAALDSATERDLSGWIGAWLETSGHDTLRPNTTVDDSGLLTGLSIERVGPDDARRPHATTVGLYQLRDSRLELTARHELRIVDDVTEVPVEAGSPCPDLVLVNDLDHTFAAVALDERGQAALRGHIADLAPIARAVAWTALWTQLRAGALSSRHFIDAVLTAGEQQSGLLAATLSWAQAAVARFTPDGDVAVLAELWRDGARRELLSAEPGSPAQLLWAKAYLRAAALAHEDVAWLIAEGAVPGLKLSVELMWLICETRSTQGVATDEELGAALATDDTAAGRVSRLRCWASRPEPQIKAEAWRRAHAPGGETNENVDALLAGFNAPGQQSLRAPYADGYFASLTSVWADQPIEIAMRLVRGGFPDAGHRAGDAWLAANPSAPATLRRLLIEAVFEGATAADVRQSGAALRG